MGRQMRVICFFCHRVISNPPCWGPKDWSNPLVLVKLKPYAKRTRQSHTCMGSVFCLFRRPSCFGHTHTCMGSVFGLFHESVYSAVTRLKNKA